MSFAENGVLVVGDAGHTTEKCRPATAGANLGWPIFEGFACSDEPSACDALEEVTMPLVTYGRGPGVRHRRRGVPVPVRRLLHGRIWALEADPEAETGWSMRELAQTTDLRILSFASGEEGNVLVLTADGPILRLEPLAE